MHIDFFSFRKKYTAHEPKVGNNTLDQQVYDYPVFTALQSAIAIVKCINSNNHACKKVCLSA